MFKLKEIFFSIAIFSAVSCFCSDTTKVALQLTEETVTQLKDIMGSSSPYNPLIITTAIVQVAPIAKDGYQYFFPNEEQQVNLEINKERLEFLKTRKKFRACLYASKPDSLRDVFNCPTQCKDLVIALSMCDAQDEAIQMIEKFDKLWKKHA